MTGMNASIGPGWTPSRPFGRLDAAVEWYGRMFGATVAHRERIESDGVEEALLQVAGLHRTHPQAAQMAAKAAEVVLREPIR